MKHLKIEGCSLTTKVIGFWEPANSASSWEFSFINWLWVEKLVKYS